MYMRANLTTVFLPQAEIFHVFWISSQLYNFTITHTHILYIYIYICVRACVRARVCVCVCMLLCILYVRIYEGR